jgi:hypothetical protein
MLESYRETLTKIRELPSSLVTLAIRKLSKVTDLQSLECFPPNKDLPEWGIIQSRAASRQTINVSPRITWA